MATLNRLSALHVKNAAPGKYSDGGGLWLHRRADGGGQWFLRVQIHGRRREMGLGSIAEVSLKEAREEAARWRAVVRAGKDPIKERERLRREAAKADHTLSTVAKEAFEARKAELKNDGKSGRWFSPLELHILPKLGNVPIEEIDQQDIKNALAPIWHSKGETAQKALGRLGIVIQHGAAMGLAVDIQATAKAKALLGKSRQKRSHIPAMPWAEVPEFYNSLNEGSITHLALRLLILTAVRSHPVRHCHIDDIDGNTWVIPAERMKSGKEFRVPLSTEALSVIEQAAAFTRDGYLFPSVRKGVISDATMSRMMERREVTARPHGFRSSFRTWCAEATDTPREIAEMALAHSIGGKVELSYRRTDYLEKRRALMERWASHVTGNTAEIVQLVAK
ncbi:tyrosine-type recombinase/integrase [Leisingera sp. JC1]|uniref:tyrosine-type recombinase/integrase n=1 Tax=Leisingera sp. JC1 TaxID=1855282 RepID=UPI000802EF93|nr:site-specific integrase [Leisingera sp. JC1]OBY25691.1 integrase [Leisingera sp. JC1]